jgi:ATP-dependent RNA helicase SUPV3L1/SUV3
VAKPPKAQRPPGNQPGQRPPRSERPARRGPSPHSPFAGLAALLADAREE